ncbi:HipA domain-containing protein [Desertivirga xinjiangensis]|uniref:HipA domain-containing protein n=1 Tax=Desertivirga xinjiangensis TaxID=539206 RepID=UPI00210DAD40|nr:HipA domain-containing protein [Pedobacter xinjiangensis]
MSNRKCLYCYSALEENTAGDFHEQCCLDFFGTKQQPLFEHSREQMTELAKNVVERSIAVPGVQPKLSLSLVNNVLQDGNKGRLTIVGTLGGNYIFKPPSDYFPEMPENEHVTMRIAEAFGINVVKSSLIRLKSGELSYITKRIDRTDAGEKIHMLDMFQITEAFDKYKSSMEKIGKALNEYSDNTLLDKVYFLELAVFSFLTGNNDMHLKNFSMINRGDRWTLAPAYDLLNVAIVNPEDTEELALTLEGKKRKLQWQHFERLGTTLGLNKKQINGIAKRFQKNKVLAFEWINNSFLSEEYKEKYRCLLEERYARIETSGNYR